jgi:hypothetical protein
MQIKIEGALGDEDEAIILTNRGYDNLNFISIIHQDKEIEVNINELKIAIDAFLAYKNYIDNIQ